MSYKYYLDEDCKKESENINITPRESCMILDCFNYVLLKWVKKKLIIYFVIILKKKLLNLDNVSVTLT